MTSPESRQSDASCAHLVIDNDGQSHAPKCGVCQLWHTNRADLADRRTQLDVFQLNNLRGLLSANLIIESHHRATARLIESEHQLDRSEQHSAWARHQAEG